MENRIAFKSFQKVWDLQTCGLLGPGGTSYDAYHIEANELIMFLDPNKKYKCLELGCGNGDLYSHMCSFYLSYTGVDFSSSNIKKFREQNPDLDLVVGNVLEFTTDQSYDLIHSNHLVQFLTADEVYSLQKKILPMCSPGGIIIHRGFLDRKLLSLYFRGYLYPGIYRLKIQRMFHPLAYRLVEFFNHITRTYNLLGFWHTRDAILDIHRNIGANVEIYNSPAHHNRFNIVVRK